MDTRPTILLVEDDDFAAEFVVELLSADYTVHRFDEGRSALTAFVSIAPDLVLLDVSMPGLSGYDVCRILRNDPTIGSLPIIFLSGMVSEKERLAGYEAGGDDYLTKPVVIGELRSKINLAISQYAARQRLKSDVSRAFSTAMTAMTSAAELGAVVQFLQSSIKCPDYVALCREILNTLSAYNLEASVQIRGKHGTVSRTADGPCSPLEESVLNNLSTQGRIFEFGLCTSYSYDHVTIITKNKPNDDADRHGRMKDNLAMLAEGADTRVTTLDDQLTLAQQQGMLMQLVASTRDALCELEQRRQLQRQKIQEILQNFCGEFDRLCIKFGLQATQEEIAKLAQQTSQQALALCDEGLAVEHLENLLEQINHAIAAEI